jgi:5'-3' exonuclease
MSLEIDSQKSNPKILLIDFGFYLHKAIFSGETNKVSPVKICLSMIIGDLKKIGCHPDDTFIIAVDSPKGSWRRDIDSNYKKNRKKIRDDSGINWTKWFSQFDSLKLILTQATPFNFIEIEQLEADDIIAATCQFYKSKECIILSSDSDFEQLASFKNVKIFSPLTKVYKIVKNPYAALTKKLNKEPTDNLKDPILNERDFEKRNRIVNLINLPADIKNMVMSQLYLIKPKTFNIDLLPYPDIKARFMDIFNSTPSFRRAKKKRKKGKQISLTEEK